MADELVQKPIDHENLAEEMADVLSYVLLLIHIAERDNEIVSKDDIGERAFNKKVRRKGWL